MSLINSKIKMSNTELSMSNIYSYEEFLVEEMLKKLSPQSEDIRPKEVEGFVIPPDFYLAHGIPALDLTGETVVEVKANLSNYTQNDMKAFFKTHSYNGYNVLVVFFKSSLAKIPETAIENNKKLVYISFSELKKKAKAKIISEDDFNLRNTKDKDWKERRDELIEVARDAVRQGNNALFLGAGVSMSAKMPSWSDLLKGLMMEVKKLKVDSLKAFSELDTHVYSECGDSNLIMARYLETAIKLGNKAADFHSLIRTHLYKDPHNSDLLTDLALIVKDRKVDEVVTYNFDDILEQELRNQGLIDSKQFSSIARDADISGHNTLPIYHVHGIIPQQGAASEDIVFAEDVYHERYKNVYHWSNIEQLHAMSRKHCFFVGLSMVDPNLRRLLDFAKKMNDTDNPPHFAFLQRTKLENYCTTNNKACKMVQMSQSLIDKNKQRDIYNLNYMVLEDIYKQLGVNVIWYEDHSEIPELIEQIFDVKPIQKTSNQELLEQLETKIAKLEDIESKCPTFNPVTLGLNDQIAYITYITTYANEYRTLVRSCSNALDELSRRLEFSTPEEVKKLLDNTSTKFDNLNGYASFFKAWYDSIKDLVR